jgi:hypothetical protein
MRVALPPNTPWRRSHANVAFDPPALRRDSGDQREAIGGESSGSSERPAKSSSNGRFHSPPLANVALAKPGESMLTKTAQPVLVMHFGATSGQGIGSSDPVAWSEFMGMAEPAAAMQEPVIDKENAGANQPVTTARSSANTARRFNGDFSMHLK